MKTAFTLAETLITLGIIGVVAALTIPSIIKNYQKKQTAIKLKQTYSLLTQGIRMAEIISAVLKDGKLLIVQHLVRHI